MRRQDGECIRRRILESMREGRSIHNPISISMSITHNSSNSILLQANLFIGGLTSERSYKLDVRDAIKRKCRTTTIVRLFDVWKRIERGPRKVPAVLAYTDRKLIITSPGTGTRTSTAALGLGVELVYARDD